MSSASKDPVLSAIKPDAEVKGEKGPSATAPAVGGGGAAADAGAEETAAVAGKPKENTGRWSYEEHRLFLKGLEMHGKGWKKIAGLIKTRTVVQIRTHAQKYFQKLAKAKQNGEHGTVLLDRGLGRSKYGKRKSGALEGTAVAPSLQPYMTLPGVNGSVESGLYKFLSPNVITSFISESEESKAESAQGGAMAKAAVGQRAAEGRSGAPATGAKSGGAKGGARSQGAAGRGGASYTPTPEWYAMGNNVDMLLNEAEELDWLADSGGNGGENDDAPAEGSAAGAGAGAGAPAQRGAGDRPSKEGLPFAGGTRPMVQRSHSNPEMPAEEDGMAFVNELMLPRRRSADDLQSEMDVAYLGIDDEDDGGPLGWDAERGSDDILQDILHRDPLAHLDAGMDIGHDDTSMDIAAFRQAGRSPLQGGSAAIKAGEPGTMSLEDFDEQAKLDFDELGMLPDI